MMNGIYGDMTLYGHANIIGGQHRPVTICVQAIYISFSTALQVYKATFYNILWHELIACSRYVEFIAAMLKFQMSTENLNTVYVILP